MVIMDATLGDEDVKRKQPYGAQGKGINRGLLLVIKTP
jgi:hypothetical protein